MKMFHRFIIRRLFHSKPPPRGPPDNPLNLKFIKDPPFPKPYLADGAGVFEHIRDYTYMCLAICVIVKYLFPKQFNYDEWFLFSPETAMGWQPDHPAKRKALREYREQQKKNQPN